MSSVYDIVARAQRPHVPLWKQFCSEKASPGDILAHFGIDAPPVDPFGLAYEMGIQIWESVNPEAAGEFGFDEAGGPHIFINRSENINRQRFTCAHEIGHVVLGHPPSRRDRRSSLGIDPYEIAANRFAADLLMPPTWIRAYRHSSPWADLSKAFGVSEHAMRIRLETLF